MADNRLCEEGNEMEEFLWMQGMIYQMYAVEEEELLELYNARSELV
jgi:hypothetical protein